MFLADGVRGAGEPQAQDGHRELALVLRLRHAPVHSVDESAELLGVIRIIRYEEIDEAPADADTPRLEMDDTGADRDAVEKTLTILPPYEFHRNHGGIGRRIAFLLIPAGIDML